MKFKLSLICLLMLISCQIDKEAEKRNEIENAKMWTEDVIFTRDKNVPDLCYGTRHAFYESGFIVVVDCAKVEKYLK